MPAPTFIGATTNQSTAGTEFPTIAVPAGAANGDRLIAMLEYADNATANAPTGWTELTPSGGVLLATNGRVSIIQRLMSTGVTQAQWAMTPSGQPSYAKMTAAMVVYRGDNGLTFGTAVNRASSSSSTVAPSITTAGANSVVLGLFGDRTSSQTSATAPTGMTERAKLVQSGGGATSVMVAEELRATAGATGTRTATYGVASTNGYGVLLELAAASSSAPVVNAGADVTSTVSTAFSRTATATDDGTIVSRLWTKQSGPAVTLTGATTATVSLTPATAGTYVLRHTATDNDGLTGFDEFTLWVNSTSSRTDGTVTNPGNFAAVGGAGSLEASLADESDATWVESPDATTGAAVTFTLTPLKSGAVTVATKARSSTTPVITMRTILLQGSTVIATWDDVTTTSFATYTHTTTPTEAASITNFNDLRVQYQWLS